MAESDKPRRIKSIDKAFEILGLLRQTGGLTISEIHEDVSLSMGAIHTQLATLREHGVIVQNGATYRLGPRMISFGNHVRNNMSIYNAGKTEVDQLAEQSQKNVFLTIEDRGYLYTIYKSFGGAAFATEYYRKLEETPSSDIHTGASGKAILSQYDEDTVQDVLGDLPSFTPATITDVDEFLEELEQVREQGYALVDGEKVRGIRAVAAPILDNDNEVLGALTVSAPEEHMKGDVFHQRTPELVLKTKSTIEVNIHTDDYVTNASE